MRDGIHYIAARETDRKGAEKKNHKDIEIGRRGLREKNRKGRVTLQ